MLKNLKIIFLTLIFIFSQQLISMENFGTLNIIPKDIIKEIIQYLHNDNIKGEQALFGNLDNLRLVSKNFKTFIEQEIINIPVVKFVSFAKQLNKFINNKHKKQLELDYVGGLINLEELLLKELKKLIDQNCTKIPYESYKNLKIIKIIAELYILEHEQNSNITINHIAAKQGFAKYLSNFLITNENVLNKTITHKDDNNKTIFEYLIENSNQKDINLFMNKLTYAELTHIDYQSLMNNSNLSNNQNVRTILDHANIKSKLYPYILVIISSAPNIINTFILQKLTKNMNNNWKYIALGISFGLSNYLSNKFFDKYIKHGLINQRHALNTNDIIKVNSLIICCNAMIIMLYVIYFI